MSEWQPIETIEDGSEVVIFDPKYGKVFHAVAWKNGDYADPIYSEWDGIGATHWQPLPAPPITHPHASESSQDGSKSS